MLKKAQVRETFALMMRELIEIRKSKGLQRVMLPKYIEVPLAQLENWEVKGVIPSVDGFIMYCLAIGVNPADYIGKYFNFRDGTDE